MTNAPWDPIILNESFQPSGPFLVPLNATPADAVQLALQAAASATESYNATHTPQYLNYGWGDQPFTAIAPQPVGHLEITVPQNLNPIDQALADASGFYSDLAGGVNKALDTANQVSENAATTTNNLALPMNLIALGGLALAGALAFKVLK